MWNSIRPAPYIAMKRNHEMKLAVKMISICPTDGQDGENQMENGAEAHDSDFGTREVKMSVNTETTKDASYKDVKLNKCKGTNYHRICGTSGTCDLKLGRSRVNLVNDRKATRFLSRRAEERAGEVDEEVAREGCSDDKGDGEGTDGEIGGGGGL
ncbi:hypothetical protein BDC45DRAFT_561360 [Circinella umbellata]|nr:hypothetical protein BDC45DRAFT_561360 [Circinella umbellata]